MTRSVFDRAVYGLQLTVQFAATPHEGNLNPLVGCYSMYGSPEGTVEFGHRGYESDSLASPELKNASVAVVTDDVDDEDAGLTFTDDDDMFPNSTTNVTTLDTKTPVSTPQFEAIPRYNGQTMAVKDVFAIALDVMVLGAEKGPFEPVSRITTRTFDMLPIYDAHGQTKLRYKALVKTMRILMRWMVAKKRFAEVDVELVRDGVVMALGRLKNGLSVGSQ